MASHGRAPTPGILKIDHAIECVIVKRLNRFVVQVQVQGNSYRASINNTGRLLEFLVPDRRGFCVRHEKHLKTDFHLFAIEERGVGALIDTQLQMRTFERALETGMIPWLRGYRTLRRNAPLEDSLVDYLLGNDDEEVYLEVKSAVLRDGGYAMYPDCPSLRGQKHIRTLTRYRRGGGKAFILFMAALPEVSAFKPNQPADPELYRLLVEAQRAGVAVKALNIVYQPDNSSISLANPDLPVDL